VACGIADAALRAVVGHGVGELRGARRDLRYFAAACLGGLTAIPDTSRSRAVATLTTVTSVPGKLKEIGVRKLR
jgi:hypothetical protein